MTTTLSKTYPLDWWTQRIKYGHFLLQHTKNVTVSILDCLSHDSITISYEYINSDETISKVYMNFKTRPDEFYDKLRITIINPDNTEKFLESMIDMFDDFDIYRLNDGDYWKYFMRQIDCSNIFIPGYILLVFCFECFFRCYSYSPGYGAYHIKDQYNKKIRRILYHIRYWASWKSPDYVLKFKTVKQN